MSDRLRTAFLVAMVLVAWAVILGPVLARGVPGP